MEWFDQEIPDQAFGAAIVPVLFGVAVLPVYDRATWRYMQMVEKLIGGLVCALVLQTIEALDDPSHYVAMAARNAADGRARAALYNLGGPLANFTRRVGEDDEST